ncbi:MAG: ribosome-binding factor A, partial [Desulfobulbaceae bacterium]|nr:ribosome-binding factor A [Desulfobulbaceae bacterium]
MEFDFKLPGLGRPESSRPKRVSEAVKNELSLLLLRDASDPRLTGV